MKAYKVYYGVGGEDSDAIVLVDEGETLEEALSEKDTDFQVDSRWSCIYNSYEIPLSTVLISTLSVTELLKLIK